MTFSIRLAREEDHEALVLNSQLLNQHEEPLVHNRRTDRAGAEDTLADFQGRVQRSGGVTLIAEEEGEVVGHLALTFEDGPVYVREDLRPFAQVAELFVLDRCRGRGLGQALLARAEEIAVARGYRQMMIGYVAGNLSAETAYRRFGFEPYAHDLIKKIGG